MLKKKVLKKFRKGSKCVLDDLYRTLTIVLNLFSDRISSVTNLAFQLMDKSDLVVKLKVF